MQPQLIQQVRVAASVVTMVAWAILIIALGFVGWAMVGAYDVFTYSDVDLTLDRLKWAAENMQGAASTPEPVGRQWPLFEIAAGLSSFAAFALFWTIGKLARLVAALAEAEPANQIDGSQ